MRLFFNTIKQFRIKWWPFIWAHCLTGFFIAHQQDALGLHTSFSKAILGASIWTICLSGAASGIANVFTTSVLGSPKFMSGRPAVSPLVLGWISTALMLVGWTLSPMINWGFFDAYSIGLIIVVIYTVPPVKFARYNTIRHFLLVTGYPALTLCAGMAIGGVGVFEERTNSLYVLAFVLLFFAMRLLVREDASIRFSYLSGMAISAAFISLGWAEIYKGGTWRLMLLVPPCITWALLAVRHKLSHTSAGEGKLRVPLLLLAGLITDSAIIALSQLHN